MKTRGKRSLHTADSSPVNPLRRRTEDTISDGLSERVHWIQTAKEITMSLLERCFQTLNEGIWWRILPLEDGYDDISVGMGINWEDLLPLLINYIAHIRVVEEKSYLYAIQCINSLDCTVVTYKQN